MVRPDGKKNIGDKLEVKESLDQQQRTKEVFSRRDFFHCSGWAGLTLAAGAVYVGAFRALSSATHNVTIRDIERQPSLYVGKNISISCSLEHLGWGRLEWRKEVAVPIVRPPDAFALPIKGECSDEVEVFSIREGKRSDLIVAAVSQSSAELAQELGKTTQIAGELVRGKLDGKEVFALRLF